MKNVSVYIIIVLCLFILSWCSSIANNNNFDKKVKCYELWRQYIKDLESGLGESSNTFYTVNWIYYSKKEQTCFMEFTQSYSYIDKPNKDFKFIVDILKSKGVINDVIVPKWYETKYLEIRNLIQGNPEYKSFNFN